MNFQKRGAKNKSLFLILTVLFVLSIFISLATPNIANAENLLPLISTSDQLTPTDLQDYGLTGDITDTNIDNIIYSLVQAQDAKKAGLSADKAADEENYRLTVSEAQTVVNNNLKQAASNSISGGEGSPGTCPSDIAAMGFTKMMSPLDMIVTKVTCKLIDSIFLFPARVVLVGIGSVPPILSLQKLTNSLQMSNDPASGRFVISMWTVIRDIINVVFMLAFMIMALLNVLNTLGLGSALGGKLESWQVKKMIPAMIGAIILVNFSLSICNLFRDFANFIVNIFFPIVGGSIAPVNNGLLGGASELFDSGTFNDFVTVGGGTIVAAIVKVIAISAYAILLLYIWILMWIREFVIKLLFIFAGIPYVAMILPIDQVKKITGQWWDQFIKWIMMAPIISLFLFISAYAIKLAGENGEFSSIDIGALNIKTTHYGLTQLLLAIVILYIGITQTLKVSKDAGNIMDKIIEKTTFGTVKGVGDAWKKTGGKKIEQFKAKKGAALKGAFYGAAAGEGKLGQSFVGKQIGAAMNRSKVAELKTERAKSEAEDTKKRFETKQSEDDRIRALKIPSTSAIEEKALARYQNMSTENAIKALESDLTPPDQKAIILKALTLQAREKYDDPTKGISSKDALDYIGSLKNIQGKSLDAFSEINAAEVLHLMDKDQIGGKLIGPGNQRQKVSRNTAKVLEEAIDMADDDKLKAAESALSRIEAGNLSASQQSNVKDRLKEAARKIIDESGFNIASDDDALQLMDDIKHNRATAIRDTSGNAIDLNSLQAQKSAVLSNAKQGVYSALDKIQKTNEATLIRSSVQRINNMINDPALVASFAGDADALIMNYQTNLDSALSGNLSPDQIYNFAKNYYPDLTVGKTPAEAHTAIVARMESDRNIAEVALGQYTRDNKFGQTNNQQAWFKRMSKSKKQTP